MEIELDELLEIAIQYFDIDDEQKLKDDLKDFMYCYETIRHYPCVISNDTGSLIDCLYLVAYAIAKNDYLKLNKNSFYDNYLDNYKSLYSIIDEALYRIYGDYSIAYLSKEYIQQKKLKI